MHVGRQGLGGGCVAGAQVYDSATGSRHGAKVGITAAGQSNDFATNGIFLCAKFKSDERGGADVVQGCSEGVKALSTKKEGNVTKEERLCVSSNASEFARAKKEKESKTKHVGKGQVSSHLGADGLGHDVLENGDRDWFDAGWWRVGFAIGRYHLL